MTKLVNLDVKKKKNNEFINFDVKNQCICDNENL